VFKLLGQFYKRTNGFSISGTVAISVGSDSGDERVVGSSSSRRRRPLMCIGSLVHVAAPVGIFSGRFPGFFPLPHILRLFLDVVFLRFGVVFVSERRRLGIGVAPAFARGSRPVRVAARVLVEEIERGLGLHQPVSEFLIAPRPALVGAVVQVLGGNGQRVPDLFVRAVRVVRPDQRRDAARVGDFCMG